MSERLFIIANRLPIQINETGKDIEVKPSSGGLVSAVESYLKRCGDNYQEVFWAGVPGCNAATWIKAEHKIPQTQFTYLPVLIYKDQYDAYYNGFSNSLLWPLFHYFPSYAEYKEDHYQQYVNANEHFADMLLKVLRPNDTVWIHDYHLLPLAEMLRKQMPELTIGFFLHIPFPSYELIRLMPRKWQEGLLKGMLGADLIGFHTIDYASHFLHSVQMILGLDHDKHVLKYKNRLIKVDVFPISIDYDAFNNAHDDVLITNARETIKEKFAGKKIIFSVDRLDYTKGVHHRLRGYEQFLMAHPEYHEQVVFVIVVVPSRDNIPKYHERKREIDETISHINSSIGNLNWQPVIYQYNCLMFDEMLALYTACDIALITPLRDGMNLVSKEFVASRKDEKGVLIISEMAGSARELTSALSINPNDSFEIAAKIKQALEMNEQEQRERMILMQQRIKDYDVQSWAQDFLNQLNLIKEKQKEFQIALLDDHNKGSLINAYCDASKRLLLLDYDGTLVPFSALPNLALPSAHVKNTLVQLCNDKRNDTFIISGRPAQWLEQHFADVPINLIAEHGAKMKIANKEWMTEVRKMDDWQEQVFAIMKGYEKRCAHSFTEVKEFSMVWHYRNAAPEQGKLRAAELLTELHAFVRNKNLQVLCGNKNIEVRNSGIDKGSIVKKILNKESYDFVLAIGDDRTDEDMFNLLMNDERSYTIKVGLHASYAKYNLLTPQTVISLLDTIYQWNRQRTTKEHQFI